MSATQAVLTAPQLPGLLSEGSYADLGTSEDPIYRLSRNLSDCCKYRAHVPECLDCRVIGPRETHRHFCGSRFCDRHDCAAHRYKKALARFSRFGLPRKLIHLIIGFDTTTQYKRHDKLLYEKSMTAFFRKLKASGIDLKGVKVFDIQSKDHSYLHYHYALIPINPLNFHKPLTYSQLEKLHEIRQEVIDELGLSFIVHIKPKLANYSAIRRYFAKRTAGLYGHGKKKVTITPKRGKPYPVFYGFTISEKMDLASFSREFSGFRALSSLHLPHVKKEPEEEPSVEDSLSCNLTNITNAMPNFTKFCPNCGSDRIHVHVLTLETRKKPPDDMEYWLKVYERIPDLPKNPDRVPCSGSSGFKSNRELIIDRFIMFGPQTYMSLERLDLTSSELLVILLDNLVSEGILSTQSGICYYMPR